MVGPLKNRETRPTASPICTAPSISVIAGVCVLLALMATCATDSLAENPAATPADLGNSLSSLKTEIERLSTRIQKLQERVTIAKPSPATELDALRAQVDELARSAEALPALAKKVETLDDQAAAADKQIASFRERVLALKAKKKRAADSALPTGTTNPPETLSDDDLAQGLDAFKAAKYQEANDLFHALTVSRPNDARVWYYAALSHGLATNQWKDETIQLFNKAVEREKAGTPDKAKIDASLIHVTEPSVKKWVDYFRRAAQR